MSMDEIKKIDAKIALLDVKRRKLLGDWAIKSCPHKVGDTVSVCGYSHTGKKCKITSIGWKQVFRGPYQWVVRGVVLLKDGTEGKIAVEWNQSKQT
jgi:hypothetical protein